MCFSVAKIQFWKCEVKFLKDYFGEQKYSYARNLVKRCLNLLIMPSSLVKLMELSNHSNVAITKRYLGLKQEEILQIYDCLIFCFFITINWQKRKTNCKNSFSRIRNVWRRIRKSWWSVKAFFYFAKAKIFFAKANLKCWWTSPESVSLFFRRWFYGWCGFSYLYTWWSLFYLRYPQNQRLKNETVAIFTLSRYLRTF